MSLVDYLDQVDGEATELEKQAAEEDAAGRIMARGFMDELNKLAGQSMRLGGGGRFQKLKQEVGHGVGGQATAPVAEKKFKKGPTEWWKKAAVQDPAALAAAIGRKKYGKKRYQEMAAAGRRRKGKKEKA